MKKIIVKGARENNLKNIDIELPKDKIIVMTGLSGSGKTSLAFDTIYKEGQRRYVESLSSYARQFLGGTEKPDVDSIEGLSPSISIDQRTTSSNPRSTVGTVTEIYDYLRILYARIGIPYCITHNIPIESQTIEEMASKTYKQCLGKKAQILSPIVTNQKGTHKKELEYAMKEGFIRAKVDGEYVEIEELKELDKNKRHHIYIVVDRLVVKEDNKNRISEACELATQFSHGKVIIDCDDKEVIFNEKYACPICGYSIDNLEPSMFSFNSPMGACTECNGLGTKLRISEDLILDMNLSINDGAIKTISNQSKGSIQEQQVRTVCMHYDIDMRVPFSDIPIEKRNMILYGTDQKVKFSIKSNSGRVHKSENIFEGIITNLQRRYFETSSQWMRLWINNNFMVELTCPKCEGKRLKEESLHVYINGKNIYEVTLMSIEKLYDFLDNLKLNEEQTKIATLAINEIKDRLKFLINVGLEYLNLSRRASTLSGGEAQRIRLATQIGSRLTGVLYVLDEPSIGLHQKDNARLIESLKEMRDLGNTLIIVEHDEEMMNACDYLVDIGPGAGIHGGEVVAAGTPEYIKNHPKSITGKYLSGEKKIEVPKERKPQGKRFLKVKNATENNLKNIDVSFPLGLFICVTGVSGSGKSTLVNNILYNTVHNHLYKSKHNPGKSDGIEGLEYIDRIIDISQSPIGRTPRSNPATYTGVFDHIRDLYTMTNEAKIRGYKKGRFSFNVKGGRCESCKGDGVKKISMHFLPDVYVPCSVCKGLRYNSDTLEVKYKGKNIADVLDLTAEEALKFFSNIPKIKNKLSIINDIGLGYLKLGQSATTLSGGEAQRVKLASELYKKITDKTLYILDEPTTGLHSDDIKKLIKVLKRIINEGGNIIVIEHNLDIIKVADYIIDLGPNGGEGGGNVLVTGTPEKVSKDKESYTAKYLKKVLYK